MGMFFGITMFESRMFRQPVCAWIGIGLATIALCIGAPSCVQATTPSDAAREAAASFSVTDDIFIRITKSLTPGQKDGNLELFTESDEGRFVQVGTWPICTWSGELGPKLREGDGQSPEGFYFIKSTSLNPNSSYHLSFNLGFPNAYDRALGRTGSFLMVHGNCVSIGCFAMTDPGIEEIYGLVEQAFARGQTVIRVHTFPFPMTDENLAQHSEDPNYAFWQNLQEGWTWFETDGRPPNVVVRGGRYVFEALGTTE